MISENTDKIEKILALISDIVKDNETSLSDEAATTDVSTNNRAQLLITIKLLERLADTALRMNKSQSVVATLKPDDSAQFISILTETATKLFDFYRNAIKQLPPETIEALLIKLNVSKTLFVAELETEAKDVRLYVTEIAELQKQKVEIEVKLEKRIAEVDRMCQRIKDLEETLRIYAESNHRVLNNLPRRLNEATAKMEAVEKLLGEVDEDMRKTLEKHQRSSSVMKIIEV